MTKAIFVKTIKRNFLYKSWFFKNTVIPIKVKNKEAAIRYSPSLKPKIYIPTNDLPNNKIEHNNIKNALNKKDFDEINLIWLIKKELPNCYKFNKI